jgi:non-ribosomal peptide synthase protein (TIGR01720 family)
VEEALASIWCEVLGLARAGVHDNFFEAGGDSILSIQFVARASQSNLHLTPRQVFTNPTIAELGQLASVAPSPEAEQEPVTGPVPLTPIQHWFFERNLPEPHHFNQSVMLELRRRIETPVLAGALRSLLLRHDSLRLRFERRGDAWAQWIAPPDTEIPFVHIDLAGVPPQRRELIERHVSRLQASLNLTHGPLLRLALFDRGGSEPDELLLVVHHLAVDGVSWAILLEDLERACEQLSEGNSVQLPPKTSSFRSWSEQLQRYADSPELREEATFWLTQTPLSLPDAWNSSASNSFASIRASLDHSGTNRLLEAPREYRASVQEMLITAVVAAFREISGRCALLLDLEAHGREELFGNVDVSRTAGWFTARYPLYLQLPDEGGPAEWLKAVKTQMRRVPRNGIGYGVLRYLHRDRSIREALAAQPKPIVSFNYFGQLTRGMDRPCWRRASRTAGDRASSNPRAFALEIGGGIEDGRLELDWQYNPGCYSEGEINRLVENFVLQLQQLLSLSPARALAVSDFPAASVSQKELEWLLAALEQVGASADESR